MARLSVLAVFLGLCLATSFALNHVNLQAAKASALKIRDGFQTLRTVVTTDPSSSAKRQPPPRCVLAFLAMNNSGCLPDFDNTNFETFDYAGVCSVCPARILTFFAECRDFVGDDNQFTPVAFFLSLLCSKEGDDFCLPTFSKFIDLFDNQDPITTPMLNGICSPCFARILRLLFSHTEFKVGEQQCAGLVGAAAIKCEAEARINLAKFIDVLCTKDGNDFCLVEVGGLSFFNILDKDVFPCGEDYAANRTAAENVQCASQASTGICSTLCRRRLFFKGIIYTSENGAFEALRFMNFLCTRDGQQFCYPKTVDAFQDFEATAACPPEGLTIAPGTATVGPTCPTSQECKTAANTLVNDVGCCWIPYKAFLTAVNQSQGLDRAEPLLAGCGITLGQACPPVRGLRILRRIFLLDLVAAYIDLNLAIIRVQIARDIAAFLGVLPSDVEVDVKTDSSKRSSTLDAEVEISFRGWSDSESNSLASQFDSSVKSNTLILPSFESSYGTANPRTNLVVSETNTDSPSSVLTVSFVVCLVAFLVALF